MRNAHFLNRSIVDKLPGLRAAKNFLCRSRAAGFDFAMDDGSLNSSWNGAHFRCDVRSSIRKEGWDLLANDLRLQV